MIPTGARFLKIGSSSPLILVALLTTSHRTLLTCSDKSRNERGAVKSIDILDLENNVSAVFWLNSNDMPWTVIVVGIDGWYDFCVPDCPLLCG